MKYIKHLISFLLVFGLTVNECSIYSQTNSANYQQVTNAITRKGVSRKTSELYVYTAQAPSETLFSFVLFIFQSLKKACSTQILHTLKLRSELYQKIAISIAQQLFLNKTITSNNHYSSLYIA